MGRFSEDMMWVGLLELRVNRDNFILRIRFLKVKVYPAKTLQSDF